MSLDFHSAAAPTRPQPMQMTVQSAGEVIILRLSGCIDASATGALCDALVAHIRAGWRHMVVELSAQAVLTRPGLRGLVVAAKLLLARRGQMRICGASPETEAFVRRESFCHLLRFAPDRDAALVQIAAA